MGILLELGMNWLRCALAMALPLGNGFWMSITVNVSVAGIVERPTKD